MHLSEDRFYENKFNDTCCLIFYSIILGVITNSEKKLQVGRITASFLIGSKKLYEFVDNNPFIVMMGIDYVNDEFNIAQNPKVTAINSCIEVDILGQVCADSIGTRVYSGMKISYKSLDNECVFYYNLHLFIYYNLIQVLAVKLTFYVVLLKV